ncbi:glycosyltransferase family 2 protein [Flavobacteriaceae bacterium TP-CH-4]|uniref:Glycosyltransferase family 2 protein n=1 Tax=Pelagihabitans pacificus TaxID=2696054 RepID=A0A967E7X9_9FLAO|nr:glycosyltransferase family 2 protein [Pelagihabitans pacificus]NHF61080.1 glycosyltransferase family 2 protein [Pelagihabitans pacificus]
MLSVVIPLYNKELSIERTIASVLKQTYASFELIVVDDGSTDKSVEIVENFTDDRIRLIKKANGGVSSARNKGIEAANYDWLAFLDADDFWHEDYLLEISKVIERPIDIEVIATGFARINKDGTILKSSVALRSGIVDYFKATNESGYNVLNMSTFCVKKTSLLSIGMFSKHLTHGEDMEVFEKLARRGNIWIVNKVLSYYVMDAENRAMGKLPDIEKHRLYYVDSSEITSDEERLYQKTRILNSIVERVSNFDVKGALALLKRQRGLITMGVLVDYMINRFLTKIGLKRKPKIIEEEFRP